MAETFGGTGTTIVFAIVISIAVVLVIGIAAISSKYTFRAWYGVYDPICRTTSRYSYMMDMNGDNRILQPYVYYNHESFFMFGNEGLLSRRNRVQKLNVLTKQQLNDLFPLKKYKDWLTGGKEEIQNLNAGKVGYANDFHEDEIVPSSSNPLETDLTDFETQQTDQVNKQFDVESNINIVINEDDVDLEKNQTIPPAKENFLERIISRVSGRSITEVLHEPVETEKHFTSGSCAICLEDLKDEENVRGLLCGHVFHQICIDPWLTERKGCCPICKKDLYMEVIQTAVNDTNDENANTNINLDMNSIINLPTGEPGSSTLDSIFNIHSNNIFSFFMILIITRLKAQTLLAALQYSRQENLNLDDGESDDIVEEQPADNLRLINDYNDHYGAAVYSQQIADKFKQALISDSFEKPPLVDLENLNVQIKRIVENQPRPFNPSDLQDLDFEAWKETKKMMVIPRSLFFKYLGISTIQLYYFNIVKLYEKKRQIRLHQ